MRGEGKRGISPTDILSTENPSYLLHERLDTDTGLGSVGVGGELGHEQAKGPRNKWQINPRSGFICGLFPGKARVADGLGGAMVRSWRCGEGRLPGSGFWGLWR